MKPLVIAAITLVILGVVALTYQGITYTTSEKALDLGPLQISTQRTHTIPLAPILGIVALGGGIVLFFTARRRT
jgi:hypothetical protein